MVGLHILLGLKTLTGSTSSSSCPNWFPASPDELASNKPVVGKGNFIRESGIGIDLVMTKPLAMFGTAPRLTGREAEIVLGKKSGKASITYTLEKLGIKNVSDESVTRS